MPSPKSDNQKVCSKSQCHERYDSEFPSSVQCLFSYMSKREKIKEIKEEEYSSWVSLENDAIGGPEPGFWEANSYLLLSGMGPALGGPHDQPSLITPFLPISPLQTCPQLDLSPSTILIKCIELTTDEKIVVVN